jgi:hypothetical protein
VEDRTVSPSRAKHTTAAWGAASGLRGGYDCEVLAGHPDCGDSDLRDELQDMPFEPTNTADKYDEH